MQVVLQALPVPLQHDAYVGSAQMAVVQAFVLAGSALPTVHIVCCGFGPYSVVS